MYARSRLSWTSGSLTIKAFDNSKSGHVRLFCWRGSDLNLLIDGRNTATLRALPEVAARSIDILVVAVLFGIVLSSWVAAGSGNLPLIEEWRLLYAYDNVGDYLSTGGQHQWLHPLIGLPDVVAYAISPSSLYGFPIVLAVLL